MLQSLFACVALLIACTLLHYEALRTLNIRLPSLQIPDRVKVVVVILGAFAVHLLEMLLYGAAFYALETWWRAGQLTGLAGSSWITCLYFSAETYTSLGFGDITPVGPVRMLVGTEALAGLLMIAWTASFTYLSMERFWRTDKV